VRETLLATFGLYGGAFVLSFIAGMFPLLSIELFLIFVMTYSPPDAAGFVLLVLLAASGHQVAKTVTFYMGVGALENKRMKARVEKVRARIERWNKRPKLIMFISATIGLPPLWLLGFIAEPLMKMRIVPFTLIVFFGRIGRYAFLMLIPVVVG
jgi:membrane protein YqaA with SNARE-associated domain